MCLAIYKPRGIHIAKKYLCNGFTNNDDGAGFAVATRDKRLEVHKGFSTFDAFYEAYQKYAGETMIIHFRWATHGDRTDDNCHPFEMCASHVAMAHNGVLEINIPDDAKHKSDTRVYCEAVLEPLLYRVPVDHPSLKLLLEKAIGAANKLVLLAANGAYAIINEAQGHWHRGAWYSNAGYSYEAKWSGYGYSNQQDYWQNIYGMRSPDVRRTSKSTGRYYRNGVEYYDGKIINDPWSDYAESSTNLPHILPKDDSVTEIDLEIADEECDCGEVKVMEVGNTVICAHCGIERSGTIPIDDLPADDEISAESTACAEWEADQRKIISLDDGR
jgi:glutamine amidotransferase